MQSISLIPDAVTANVYIKECSRRLDIDERVVALEVEKRRKQQAEKDANAARQERARKSLGDAAQPEGGAIPAENSDSPAPVAEAAPLWNLPQ